MSTSDFPSAVILGLIEGLTEFIPVSSTGHLILFVELLKFTGPPGKVFEVVIQLGAIFAVCILYFGRLWGVVKGLARLGADYLIYFWRMLGQSGRFGMVRTVCNAYGGRIGHLEKGLAFDHTALRFAVAILVAFLPAVVIGVLAHGFIKATLFHPVVVCTALIVGGLVILAAERFVPAARHQAIETFSFWLALRIGLFQCLAMVPGVSRSGATIIGGLLMGVDRRTAMEFSFFLAIPTMLGATAYDLYKNWSSMTVDGGLLIAVGFVAAFVSAALVVKMVLGFIGRHGFAPFAYYRIALGVVMLVLLYGR